VLALSDETSGGKVGEAAQMRKRPTLFARVRPMSSEVEDAVGVTAHAAPMDYIIQHIVVRKDLGALGWNAGSIMAQVFCLHEPCELRFLDKQQ
jgi:hypothetical protein